MNLKQIVIKTIVAVPWLGDGEKRGLMRPPEPQCVLRIQVVAETRHTDSVLSRSCVACWVISLISLPREPGYHCRFSRTSVSPSWSLSLFSFLAAFAAFLASWSFFSFLACFLVFLAFWRAFFSSSTSTDWADGAVQQHISHGTPFLDIFSDYWTHLLARSLEGGVNLDRSWSSRWTVSASGALALECTVDRRFI
jgi:fatty acid desaturase